MTKQCRKQENLALPALKNLIINHKISVFFYLVAFVSIYLFWCSSDKLIPISSLVPTIQN